MGECPGKVAFERLAGDYGFGYDPLFIPDECGVGKTGKRPNTEGRSYAQLTPDEKRRHQPPRQRAGKTRRRITEVFSKMSWTAGSFLLEKLPAVQ